MAIEPLDDFVSVPEAAAILQVSPSTIWRWIDRGDLSASRIGRRAVRLRRRDLHAVVKPARPAVDRSWIPNGGRMTAEERRRAAVAIERFRALHKKQLAERGGIPFPSSADDIREMREERSRQLDGEGG